MTYFLYLWINDNGGRQTADTLLESFSFVLKLKLLFQSYGVEISEHLFEYN